MLTPLTRAAHRQPAQQQQRGGQSHLSGCSWSEKRIDEERVGPRRAGFKVRIKKGWDVNGPSLRCFLTQ